jgi:hypothetical protein
MKNTKIYLVLACLALVCSPAAFAGSYTFVTASGATESGGNAVSAQVDFTTGANTLTISLTNLIVNQKTVAQNISDLFFTLGSNATSGSVTTDGLNSLINVLDGGTTTTGGTGVSGWVLSFSAGTFHLNGLGAGSLGPERTIIGAPGPGGVYTNANSSIAGNDPHNPFTNQNATWTLTIAGLTADTAVTAAAFSFGTAAGNDVPGVPRTPVPDSGMTLILLGVSLATVEGSRRLLARRGTARI